YAQVGVGKSNRLHLTDVFAATAGLQLEHGDFAYPSQIKEDAPKHSEHLVLHVGASDPRKNCSAKKWMEIIGEVCGVWTRQVYLVGTGNERLATGGNLPEQVIDLCGSTKFEDLFSIVRTSSGVIA